MLAIAHAGRTLTIEHADLGAPDAGGPLLVFLHEGLGSVSFWRDFPALLCAALQARGLVYSRPGYGHSTPRAPHERWAPDYLHQQALAVLPAVLAARGERGPYALVGHSDGGSIALIHAAHDAARRVAWTAAIAPHIDVEAKALDGIRATRQRFEAPDSPLRRQLARHHADVDSAFYGWCDAWLSPAFAPWSIEAEIAAIRCPLLAMQGEDDAYATPDQVRRIGQRVPQAQVRLLPGMGHTPFAQQPEVVVGAIAQLARQAASA
ncbi:MAG: alpha/beta hydrolase [Proteobacteria bacterium]|nr:alpha/beta hydrolase [Pseudomonadota bacterium]